MVGRSCMTIPRVADPPRMRRSVVYRAPALVRVGLGVFLALVLVLAACAPRTKDRSALVGGNDITGAGDPVLRDAVIVVHAGHIETVAPREGFKIPKSALTVDVTGGWIIPGLIDGHAHVERWALPRYVAAGVTTVRDVHGQQDSILRLREEVSLGGLVAPRIFSAGAMLDGAPATYPDANEVTNADQVRKAVDKLNYQAVEALLAAGADVNAADGEGVTPKTRAYSTRNTYLLAVLIRGEQGRG